MSEDIRCKLHHGYEGKGKPRSMCETCWRIWQHAEARRARKAAEEAEVSTMSYVDLPETELRQFVLDICDNRVFTDRHCRTVSEVVMCFPIISLMKRCDQKFIVANTPGLIWEYYSKASPTGVNGLPMFFSCHFLSPSDMDKVHPLVVAEMTRRQEFVKS